MDSVLVYFKHNLVQKNDKEGDVFWKSTSSILSFLGILVILLLGTLVVKTYSIESDLGLPRLMQFIFIVFIFHSIIPKPYRLAFFFFISITAILLFFGLIDGGIIITIALALIGICHLPIPLLYRKALIILSGLGIAYSQYAIVSTGKLGAYTFTPKLIGLLGVMFMFRMIIYLYELKYQKEETSIWQKLSYFFTLPNICFPIYPIIDFKTYNTTYYNQNDIEIYKKGIHLIVIGIFQLLIYRVIYHLVPQTNDVHSLWMLIYYIIMSYLLLIRLNGMLNIAVGFLRLFGFNLPDIFNYMFLAHGFDDYWRRINIYWKDFMVKIFYYPIYFKFRKRSVFLALTLGTMLTFFFNWLLHSYQWFWILGKFSIRGPEILFWQILCLLVLASVLYQYSNRGKSKNSDTDNRTYRFAIKRAFQVIATFFVVSFVYSIYISVTIIDWIKLLGQPNYGTVKDWVLLIGILIGIGSIGALFHWLYANKKFGWLSDLMSSSSNKTTLQFSFLLALLILTSSFVSESLTKEQKGYLELFTMVKPNKADSRQQAQGYYQEILHADNFSAPNWQGESKKPAHWKQLNKTNSLIKSGLFVELKPNLDFLFKDAKFTSNRWGLRDKDYTKTRSKNTTRIAILGGSIEMGSGVANEETFENLVEQKLGNNFGSEDKKFEIINFAISGLSTIKNIEKFHKQVLQFDPQYVLIAVHETESIHFQKTLRYINNTQADPEKLKQLYQESPWFIAFHQFLKSSEILYDEKISEADEIKQGNKILEWGFLHLKNECAKNNINFAVMAVPSVFGSKDNFVTLENIAKDASIPFLNMIDSYDNHDYEDLRIATWNNHPNAKGHELISNELYSELVKLLKLKQ